MIIKFCGIKNLVDIKKAILLNAKFIGINFFKKSIRYINNNYINLIKYIPKNIIKVALFVNNSYNEIYKIKNLFDLLQFHGDESFSFCESFNKKYIKTIKIYNKKNFNLFYSSNKLYSFLIDKKNFFYGGNGEQYIFFKNIKKNIFVSGGINLFNFKKNNKISSSFFLDICSSLEYNKVKNIKKMINFY